MDSIRIDIINPKARKLLESLENLNLISIKEDDTSFKKLISRLRNKSEQEISLEEITKEVEEVRAKRYNI